MLFYEEDAQLLLISRHRERLAKSFRFVIADATLVEDLLDKARFQDLARRHSLPVPPARQFQPVAVEPDDLDLAFPVIIKPLTRLERWNDVFGLRKALEVKDVDALRALWPHLLDAGIDLLAQQLIPGAETQIESYHCYVDQRGSIAGEFTGRKIRTFPLAYGHTRARNHRRGGRATARPRHRRAPRAERRRQARFQARPSWHAAFCWKSIPVSRCGIIRPPSPAVNIPALVYADLDRNAAAADDAARKPACAGAAPGRIFLRRARPACR